MKNFVKVYTLIFIFITNKSGLFKKYYINRNFGKIPEKAFSLPDALHT